MVNPLFNILPYDIVEIILDINEECIGCKKRGHTLCDKCSKYMDIYGNILL
jgi:hypothetical protein